MDDAARVWPTMSPLIDNVELDGGTQVGAGAAHKDTDWCDGHTNRSVAIESSHKRVQALIGGRTPECWGSWFLLLGANCATWRCCSMTVLAQTRAFAVAKAGPPDLQHRKASRNQSKSRVCVRTTTCQLHVWPNRNELTASKKVKKLTGQRRRCFVAPRPISNAA